MREKDNNEQEEWTLLRTTLKPYARHWEKWTRSPKCFLNKAEIEAVEFFLNYYSGHDTQESKRFQMRDDYLGAIRKLQNGYIYFLLYLEGAQ